MNLVVPCEGGRGFSLHNNLSSEGVMGMAREYPSRPVISCHALIRDKSKILLIKRKRDPFGGQWALPGGGIELGETVEEALVREVREETGLEVGIERFLGLLDAIDRDHQGEIQRHYVILYFETCVKSGMLRAADDAAGVQWMGLSEVRRHQTVDSVQQCLKWAGLSE